MLGLTVALYLFSVVDSVKETMDFMGGLSVFLLLGFGMLLFFVKLMTGGFSSNREISAQNFVNNILKKTKMFVAVVVFSIIMILGNALIPSGKSILVIAIIPQVVTAIKNYEGSAEMINLPTNLLKIANGHLEKMINDVVGDFSENVSDVSNNVTDKINSVDVNDIVNSAGEKAKEVVKSIKE